MTTTTTTTAGRMMMGVASGRWQVASCKFAGDVDTKSMLCCRLRLDKRMPFHLQEFADVNVDVDEDVDEDVDADADGGAEVASLRLVDETFHAWRRKLCPFVPAAKREEEEEELVIPP
ncbi:hypothetical protein ACLKA6_018036 [Drosophila palustris]